MSLDASQDNTAFVLSDAYETKPSKAELRVYVVDHIDEAIEKGWVVPYFQPVIRTLTGKLCGTEALARWEDPTYGLLGPDVFIGALEDARLIHKLDCEIIRQVCRRYRKSVDAGVPTVPISFNLSRLDFDLCDIFSVVEDAVRENEVPRDMLNIEITETVLGTDPNFMAGMMGRFHAVGYQVWMDDFGSGYSTLNALKDFDFDELKIDMEFLNRFGEKSKTILASVVDMAKKLGIQTLAEGVETEEQRDYLRRIGCEKMQGFLFGKPRPFSCAATEKLVDAIGVETPAERVYLSEIGRVNTLSLSERDLTASGSTQDYVTSMPLAIIEYANDTFKIIESNRVFREGLANVGVLSIEEAEERINDTQRVLARQARRFVGTIEEDKYARVDYVAGNTSCVMRAKHITTRNGKKALLVSVDDTIEQSERRRHGRMNQALSVLYSIYEHVDIIHLDEGFIEPVFSNSGFRAHIEAPSFDEAPESFARAEVYPPDQERYIAYLDHSTMIERIKQSGERYLVGFFRIRQQGGDYDWKLVGLIMLPDRPDNQVMYCMRSTHWSNDDLFQSAFDGPILKEDALGSEIEEEILTDGSLWRALSHDEEFAFFWKDRDRRFVGANQAFLDYYGFKSVSEIQGKTDEDMGWHIDPVPFMEDELSVLNEGVHLKDVMGQCIVQGEVRDIVATKRPVYRNGRIAGLVGYFFDAEEKVRTDDEIGRLPLRDPVTGVLNFTGLESATFKFVDSYKRLGLDFAMISINVENFEQINEAFGYEFGEKALKRIAEELRDIAGARNAIGHVYANRFVILSQNASDDELQEICDAVEHRLGAISHIDGTPCTVYAMAGFARYSVYQDVEDMKRANRDRRAERREPTE